VAFNKTKAIQEAQGLVAQGKFKDAVNAFRKIHSKEPKDHNVLNALGDLHARQNKIAEALEYYTQLADMYASEGFLVRGIAMYKKISKLDPANIHAIERLADLYTMQGMLADARAQYLHLAETYLKANQAPQAMEVLQKVLDLDPDNVKIQRRLAELYERHGQPGQAAQIYQRMAERFLAEGQSEDGNKWMEKAMALAPGDAQVLMLQARQLQESGQAAEALAALGKISNLEENPEALEMLIRAQIEAGQAADAEQKAEEMFAVDNSRFAGFLQLALHAASENNAEKAVSLLQRVLEPALAQDPFHLLEVVREVASRLPESVEVADLFLQVAQQTQNEPAMVEALGRKARAAAQSEDWTAAKELYNQLVGLEPQNPEFTRELNRARAALGEIEAVPEPELPEAVPFEVPEEPVMDEETEAFVSSTINDIDLFSSYGMSEKGIELALQLLDRVPGHIDGNEKLLDLYIGTGNDKEVVTVATRLELLHRRAGNTARAQELADIARGYAEKAGVAIPSEAAPAAEEAPAEEAAAQPQEFQIPVQKEEPAEAAFEVPVEPAEEEAPAEAAVHEVDLSAEWNMTAEQPVAEEAAEPEAAEEAAVFNAEEASQEIDFYLKQGLVDQAQEALARYEEQFSGEPGLEELRAKLQAAAAPAEEAPAEAAPIEEAEPVAAEEAEGGTFDIVLEEQPKEAETAPAEAAMSAQDFFSDLAGELDQTLEGTEAPAEPPKAAAPPPPPRPAPKPAAPAKTEEVPAGVLAEVFQAFKEEMGEVEEVEDTESHYNLGIAYKEMGLVDEAISEFQKVSKAAEKAQNFPQLFQACTLLGLCFMDKGLPQIAVRWYDRALKTPGVDEEGALALRYDMGMAHEQAGDRKAALNCFMEVYGVNVDYRDVSERIRELKGA
jgi:tetratricopeptide (TPR) repeat protein